MRNTRCIYCKNIEQELNDKQRCKACEKEFQDIGAGITKRYGGVLQKLAEK
jgi:hypothetical protein